MFQYRSYLPVLLIVVSALLVVYNYFPIGNNPYSGFRVLGSEDAITITPSFTPPSSAASSDASVINKSGAPRRHLQGVDSNCTDPEWCDVPMPTFSYFKFDPPTDPKKWRIAQIQASKGEQVLLQEVLKVFPNPLDFIDGDISFRKLHLIMDFFLDENRDLTPLTSSKRPRGWFSGDASAQPKDKGQRKAAKLKAKQNKKLDTPPETDDEEKAFASLTFPVNNNNNNNRRLAFVDIPPKRVNGRMIYPWEAQNMHPIPEPYDFRAAKRAPVVGIGYTAYERDSQTYFSGNRIGGAFIDRNMFFKHWRKALHKLETPFIGICSLNENWGFISTNFPNRTAGWGQCCQSPRDKILYDFLNHPKTLMLVSNQHTNVSHPKLLMLPRGIPITWGWTRNMVWDTMRNLVKDAVPKTTLLFATGSKWGPRPQILKCISQKFEIKDFSGHVNRGESVRYEREVYYAALGQAKFGLGLPGLGYDCFRNWELMTMGSIVVLEKGVGFDRTMWRLPALLLEDFAQLTPQLLRQAYVEALYRAKDFEFRRLTQSFWFSVISNVSASMSSQPLIDMFPMEAEDSGFTRPKVPYLHCFNALGVNTKCGKETKRTPLVSC